MYVIKNHKYFLAKKNYFNKKNRLISTFLSTTDFHIYMYIYWNYTIWIFTMIFSSIWLKNYTIYHAKLQFIFEM